MRLCTLLIFLQWIASGAVVAQTPQKQLALRQAGDVVRRLYDGVVSRRPLGIPMAEDAKLLRSFLSSRLISKLDAAKSCEDDYYNSHGNKEIKPEVAWLEAGLFSGFNEKGIPTDAIVERTEATGDRTYWVYVLLTYRETFDTYGRPPDPHAKFSWYVSAIVTLEDGHYLVDDILFFEDDAEADPKKVTARLSEILAMGCDGPRWVGYGQPNEPK